MNIQDDKDLLSARAALLDWLESQDLEISDMIILLGCTAASLIRFANDPDQACADFCTRIVEHVAADDPEEQEDLTCRPRK